MTRLSEAHIATRDGVEPALWEEYLEGNGGKPKWPYGLPMVEARRFSSPREQRDEYLLIPRLRHANLGLVLATRAILLEPNEADAILKLPSESCTLYDSPALRAARERAGLRESLRRRRTVPPTFGERTSSYESEPAWTYVFELTGPGLSTAVGDSSVGGRRGKRVYKVGYAIDHEQRLRALNFAFPNLKALSWRIAFRHPHGDPLAAIAMEAELHELLDPHTAREAGNTEIFVCEERELMNAWQKAITSAGEREREVPEIDNDNTDV
jgi:hypothetical protein